MLRQQIGARGIASLEASVLKDAKDRHRRAKALGYEDVEDRYRHLTKSYLFLEKIVVPWGSVFRKSRASSKNA